MLHVPAQAAATLHKKLQEVRQCHSCGHFVCGRVRLASDFTCAHITTLGRDPRGGGGGGRGGRVCVGVCVCGGGGGGGDVFGSCLLVLNEMWSNWMLMGG